MGIADSRSVFEILPKLKSAVVAGLSQRQREDSSLMDGLDALKWSDVRDAFAAHIFASSERNVFAVKWALNHKHVSTTRHYLRQRNQLIARFDAFRTVVEKLLTEIEEGHVVDPTILFLASNYTGFGEEHRRKLKAYRTRMGMGCANSADPDRHLAPNHIEGAVCGVQRCVICRHGIIFRDAFEGLADRHADLWWVRGHTPPERWLTSTLSWEMEAIELVRDRVFAAKVTEFNARSGARRADLSAGRESVFDDPEVGAGLR
jgi:hypothetical protein